MVFQVWANENLSQVLGKHCPVILFGNTDALNAESHVMKRFSICFCLIFACLFGHAQDSRRIVVGFPPGGALDVLGRAVAQAWGEESGKSVIVENQAGAGSLIAAQNVARAKPDGHTLLLAPVVVPAFFPHIYKKLSFDPLTDLLPVAEMGTFNFALVVGSGAPVANLSDWLTYVRKNPGKTSFGSFGAGTPAHFLGVMLNRAAQTDTLHVPYKGGAPAMQALVAGETQSAFMLTGGITLEQAKAGRIKVLAVTGDKRSALLPAVPTFAEAGLGLKEMDHASLWYGFFAPKGTPSTEVDRLNRVLQAAMKSAKVREVMAREDIAPSALSATDFAQKVQRDQRNWGEVIQSTGFSLEQ
jgi:tripartite-type tricarboxylate transporter receptor subunit TctC